MLKRLSKFAIVLALVCVVGGHWALLQSLAWVSMTINFSRTDALDTAIEKTFDGQHPCNLCHFVAEGKKSERTKETLKPATKLELISSTSFVLPAPREHEIELAVFLLSAHSRADTPPSPPPRFA
jgi:hypothetical protein